MNTRRSFFGCCAAFVAAVSVAPAALIKRMRRDFDGVLFAGHDPGATERTSADERVVIFSRSRLTGQYEPVGDLSALEFKREIDQLAKQIPDLAVARSENGRVSSFDPIAVEWQKQIRDLILQAD